MSTPASARHVTGVPLTAVMTSPLRSTPKAGRPFAVAWMVSTVLKLIPSWQSAAAVALCCEFVICAVSCLAICCCVWPGVKISWAGTTASCGLSQARRAARILKPVPGPPRKLTVTKLRCPLTG